MNTMESKVDKRIADIIKLLGGTQKNLISGSQSELNTDESVCILCSRHQQGCDWIGKPSELDKHLQSDKGCDYYAIECPSKCESTGGTTTLVLRKDLQGHLSKHCELRFVKCEYCDYVCTAKDCLDHMTTCLKLPVPCPNQCGELKIPQQDMGTHRLECKCELVECKYAYAGCEKKTQQQDMPRHMEAYQGEHLDLVNTAYAKARTVILELEEATTKSVEQNAAVKIGRMIQELQELTLKYEKLKREVEDERRIINVNLDLHKKYPSIYLRSIRTQVQHPHKLLSSQWLYFRMMDFCAIRWRQKDWTSPTFTTGKKVDMCLHVSFTPQRSMSVQLRVLHLKGEYTEYRLKRAVRVTIINNFRPQTSPDLYGSTQVFPTREPRQSLATGTLEGWIIHSKHMNANWMRKFINNDSILWAVGYDTDTYVDKCSETSPAKL